MKVVASAGREDVAMVYIAEMGKEKWVEFVESVQPPLPREKKWVLIVSTLFGCPVRCLMCDAGSQFRGKLSTEELFAQIDFLIKKRFPLGRIPVEKFKIQFARMGEPAFNKNVLEVLDELPDCYDAPGLMPSISTIAPRGTDGFFETLLQIKRKRYAGGRFQLQFSIHTTDEGLRDELIPAKKWNFAEISEYGERFFQEGDRKITLNFALAKDMSVDPAVLSRYFSPDKFLIKITPLNPTYQGIKSRLSSYIDPYEESKDYELVRKLQDAGYQVIISIGEVEENHIGSNCGQFLLRYLREKEPLCGGYSYAVNHTQNEARD